MTGSIIPLISIVDFTIGLRSIPFSDFIFFVPQMCSVSPNSVAKSREIELLSDPVSILADFF